ncbi:MAG: hypothetical protein NVSMB25_13530 [Thermoleophilaceae bacterium]
MLLRSRINHLAAGLLACALIVLVTSGQAFASEHHAHVYRGQGVVTAVDAENDTVTLDLSHANRALRRALGGDLHNVQIAVDGDTDLTVDGNDEADLSDLGEGDQLTFVIRASDQLSGHDLTDAPATRVVATSEPGSS